MDQIPLHKNTSCIRVLLNSIKWTKIICTKAHDIQILLNSMKWNSFAQKHMIHKVQWNGPNCSAQKYKIQTNFVKVYEMDQIPLHKNTRYIHILLKFNWPNSPLKDALRDDDSNTNLKSNESNYKLYNPRKPGWCGSN